MDETANLSLPYIMPAQAQKHITHNEALQRLDAIVQLAVIGRDEDTPPGAPAEGDRYLVATGAVDDWEDWDGSIAVFASGAWTRLVPQPGWLCWIADEELLLFRDTGGWQEVSAGSFGGLPLGGGTMTGPIRLTHQSSPASPASGTLSVFAKSDDRVYTRAAGGTEVALDGNGSHETCGGRLTLETGVAVSTTDQLAKTTLYFTPFRGNEIGLYDGANWHVRAFAETSITLTGLTALAQYDVFAYDNAGTLALELLQWTGTGNSRATALGVQDGIVVKSGAATRRYLGTVGMTGITGQCEDSRTKRYVWNMYNQADRLLFAQYTDASHEYHTATTRQFAGSTAMQVAAIIGLGLDRIAVRGFCGLVGSANASHEATVLGLGLDRTNDNDATHFGRLYVNSSQQLPAACFYDGHPGLGRHFLALVQKGAGGSDNNTWYGSGTSDVRTGIAGSVRG